MTRRLALLLAVTTALSSAVLSAGAQTTPAAASATAGASTSRSGPIPLRLFVDLQDAPSREMITRVATQLSKRPNFALLLHHLPLRRHRQASAAAAAAIAAREQGGELAFVQALLAAPGLDNEALRKAAGVAKLDRERLDRLRQDGTLLRNVERERRAAVAFGVRATPTALIGGRGLAGVPPLAVLEQAFDRAEKDWARCAARRIRDCERDVVRRVAPGAVAGLTALRGKGRGGLRAMLLGGEAGARGKLGARWKVTLEGEHVQLGRRNADVTAVLFADPTDVTFPEELGRLLTLHAERPWLRVVWLPLAEHDPGRGEAMRSATDASTAAWKLLAGKPERALAKALRRLADQGPVDDLGALCHRVGAGGEECMKASTDTGATVVLDRVLRLAITVDARPGSLFLNGRRWEGLVGDDGLTAALDTARAEALKVPRRGEAGPYARLVAGGKARSEAEIDLDPGEPLGDTSFMVDLGSAGPAGKPTVPVLLFVDFTRPGSRAAFHTLRMLRTDAQAPVSLAIASIASAAEPGVTPAAAVLLTAARKGKGLAAAIELFKMGDPYDWRQLRRHFRKLGFSPRRLSDGAADPKVNAAMAAAAAAADRLDMRDEPVIYIDGRRYVGPIDENRIRRAVEIVAGSRRSRAR